MSIIHKNSIPQESVVNDKLIFSLFLKIPYMYRTKYDYIRPSLPLSPSICFQNMAFQLVYFLKYPTKSSECCFYVHGCVVIPLSKENLPVGACLVKNDSLFLTSYSLPNYSCIRGGAWRSFTYLCQGFG